MIDTSTAIIMIEVLGIAPLVGAFAIGEVVDVALIAWLGLVWKDDSSAKTCVFLVGDG